MYPGSRAHSRAPNYSGFRELNLSRAPNRDTRPLASHPHAAAAGPTVKRIRPRRLLPLPRFSGNLFGKQTPRGVSGCWQFPWKTDHPERNLTGNLNVGGPGKGSITTRTLGTFPNNPKRCGLWLSCVLISRFDRHSTGTRPALERYHFTMAVPHSSTRYSVVWGEKSSYFPRNFPGK